MRQRFSCVETFNFEKKNMSDATQPTNPQEAPPAEQDPTRGRVFNNCMFNAAVTFSGNIIADSHSYGYRNIGDILRLQDQRAGHLAEQQKSSQKQQQQSYSMPPPPTTQQTSHPSTSAKSLAFPTPGETPIKPVESYLDTESAEEDFVQVTEKKGNVTEKKAGKKR